MDTNLPVLPAADYLRLRELTGTPELSGELERAVVVPTERIPQDRVTMNSRLIYIDERLGVAREIELVYPDEANPAQGKVSVLAPVGCALLGLGANGSIDWEFPNGRIHRLRVERILSQPVPSPQTET